MSTFNGEQYIEQQLESLIRQKNVDIFIRDDGSTDRTVSILENYKKKYPNIFLYKGKNIGFRRSFIDLLMKTPNYDYYAFCDQDDCWDDEKIANGISFIETNAKCDNIPIVYYSNLKICDSNLNILKKTKLENRRKSLQSNIMRRSIAGCTMIFNKEMYKKMEKRTITDGMLLRGHDSFIISLCYAIGGTVLCDADSYIRYRRHCGNSSGSTMNIFKRIKKEFVNLVNKKGQESIIAKGILSEWQSYINQDNAEILETIKEIHKMKNRFKVVFSRKYNTGVFVLTLFAKIKVIFNLL